MSKITLLSQCIAEFLGTCLLVFLGVASVASLKLTGAVYGQWEISIIWGIAVAMAVYLTAGVSGAHLNPAVTLALWLLGPFPGQKVFPYITAQFMGAFLAAVLVYFLYAKLFIDVETTASIVRGSQESLVQASIFSTYPHVGISIGTAFFVEVVIAAILLMLILALTDEQNGAIKGALSPLLIGLLIAVIGGSVGPLTGFALNPARDFAPKLFAMFAGWGSLSLTGGLPIPYCIVPLVAPVVGGIIGTAVYRQFISKSLSTLIKTQ